ncbi:MAG TPA: IS110 family transposase [Phycisphaerae bacterium]|nr:IS110 family transposase [Phycisphaerae bacterium]HUT61139.1 IS110 family transposase [Phycisphaerae bacterium]
MDEYIAFDSHKHYTLMERLNVRTEQVVLRRIEHSPGAIRQALAGCRPGTPVAVESIGSWYWIVEEIEQAGLRPLLVHPRKAKLMMGMINKTDKLDVHGLNRLQQNRTLPTVWIAPGELRDLRELTRTRLVLTRHRTRLKNRLTSSLAKYGLCVEGFSDSFGVGARRQWPRVVAKLPAQTAWTCRQLLEQLDLVCRQIAEHEKRQRRLIAITPEMQLLQTLPGIGEILAPTILLEVGDVGRFGSAEKFACYAGTTPRVHASGGRTRYGKLRPDANRYLKWALIEAGNTIALHSGRQPARHVSQLYRRLRRRKNHAKAVGAVARHLAEAVWWVLTKKEPYRDPNADWVCQEGVSAAET